MFPGIDLATRVAGRRARFASARGLAALALVAAALAAGCRQDMHDQPRYKPLAPSDFFGEGTSARHPVEGTVAWGASPRVADSRILREDEHLFTGRFGQGPSDFVASFPFEITAAELDRGQQRFNIYCSMCHGRAGMGDGMVAQRGFRRPPTFHSDRLREAPAGYLFDVITNGFGVMPPYATMVPVNDRWRIVAYIRALQLSQNASPDDVPVEQRASLKLSGES